MQYLKYSLLVVFIIPLMVFSQYKPGKAGGGLYSTGDEQVDKGWFFGLGLTYMWAYNNETTTIDSTDAASNTYKHKYIGDPKGKFGAFLEVGFFKMNGKRFINYRDFGLSWKWFRGGEDYTYESYFNDDLVSAPTTEGSYSDHLISGNFNLGHRYDASDDLFYVNGLGLNADYHIIKGRSGTLPIPEKDYVDGPSDLLGELHYFFGIGFKTGKRLIIMPMIETPILALYPFNHIVSTHPYFNTRARPFLIRVRFMFLKKGSKSCPAVYNPMGIDPNGNGPK